MRQKPTVLVIDDYPPARDAVRFALKDDYNCLSADSAREGLEILRANAVDAVVLDIRMPEMDGIQALKQMKETGINAQVILLTGYASLDSAQKAVRYGAFDYLVKPFDVGNLRSVVNEAVQKKRLLEKEGKDTELERLTQSLTAKLAQASRAARSSELSSQALKEMRSPLTAILGYTQMLLKNLKERRGWLFRTKSLRYLSIIEEEAMKCAEITSKLLSLSAETLDENGAVVNEVLLNVAALLRPQCSMSGIALVVAPPAEKVIVDASADDLHSVLVNLVLNSIEAIQGPGEINIRGCKFDKVTPFPDIPSQSEIDFLQRAPQSPMVAVEVADSGRGIAPEYLDRIFEPFFTTKTEKSGAGLGLTICKEKVERNGGHIGVAETGPGGTTIRILLPFSSRI